MRLFTLARTRMYLRYMPTDAAEMKERSKFGFRLGKYHTAGRNKNGSLGRVIQIFQTVFKDYE